MTSDQNLFFSVTQFLSHEAMLLDERRWEEWGGLFTDTGMYWVPLAHDQTDPVNHASIFYEDAIMRDVRMRRLEQVRAWSQQPVTRTSRIIGNALILDRAEGTVRVRSAFQMTEWRKGRYQRQLAGHYIHDLVEQGSGWRIALKRVNLIDCDGIQDCFEVFV